MSWLWSRDLKCLDSYVRYYLLGQKFSCMWRTLGSEDFHQMRPYLAAEPTKILAEDKWGVHRCEPSHVRCWDVNARV